MPRESKSPAGWHCKHSEDMISLTAGAGGHLRPATSQSLQGFSHTQCSSAPSLISPGVASGITKTKIHHRMLGLWLSENTVFIQDYMGGHSDLNWRRGIGDYSRS